MRDQRPPASPLAVARGFPRRPSGRLRPPGAGLLLVLLAGTIFKRLNQASLLDHFVRGRLCQVIRENPGIHFAELRRQAGFANGSTSHHLRILEQGGYLRVVIDGGKTRFYTADRPVDKSVYGLSDCDRAVLRVVAASPGISEGALSQQLDR